MTFLEYVAERLMGPPVCGSCWRCPYCDSPHASFSVRPPKPGYKVKFKCFRCGMWGDEYDLLKEFYPGEQYPRRRVRLDQWYRDWQREYQSEPVVTTTRGRPGSIACVNAYDHDPQEDEFSPEADQAVVALMEYLADPPSDRALREMLRLVQEALTICGASGLHPVGFGARVGYEVWHRELEAEHLAECDDPDCDYICCRRARGWTEEEIDADIEAGKQEREEDKRQRMERARKAIKKHPVKRKRKR